VNQLKEFWPLIVAAAMAIASFAVANYRVSQVEATLAATKGEPLKLALLEQEVRFLRCEIRNVKRILKSQPEQDC
jgi:hypothetical protein